MEHEKKQEKKSVSGLWYGIGGMAIGTLLGVLFAPKKGSELREGIGGLGAKGREMKKTMMSKLSAMVPARVKAAAALGAVKAGAAEAVEMVKGNGNSDGA